MYMFYGIYINGTLSLTDSIVGIKFSNLTYFRSRIRQLLENLQVMYLGGSQKIAGTITRKPSKTDCSFLVIYFFD
jgi:hypothetical protein